MIIGIIAILITLFVGPFMFYFFSRIIYKNSKLKKYPTQINDGIGDLIFLPLFNGIFFENFKNDLIKINFLIILFFIAIILTFLFLYYQKNADYLDWSKPKKGKINSGGFYHGIYMLFQMVIVFYGIIIFYNNFLLWLLIIGYLITTIIQYIKYGYI